MRKDARSMTDSEQRKVHNTMSTTTGSQGGFAVPGLVTKELISVVKGFKGMRQAAAQVTTARGNDLGYPTSDGTAEVGEQVAQNGTASSLDPTLGTAPVPTYKYSSKTFAVPIELLQDSEVDIVAFILQRAGERIGRIENTKFTVGTGTGEPTGLVTASSVGKTGLTGQTLTVIYDDLVDLADAVDEAQGSPGWMMSQVMRKVVRKVKDTAGRPIWTPGFIDGGVPTTQGQLLGYPVFINNDMPVPAANAKSLAFGNLQKYLVRDVLEMFLFRFDDSAYTKLGQVGFLAWARWREPA
jgi:HK97 family phage major capsid protein